MHWIFWSVRAIDVFVDFYCIYFYFGILENELWEPKKKEQNWKDFNVCVNVKRRMGDEGGVLMLIFLGFILIFPMHSWIIFISIIEIIGFNWDFFLFYSVLLIREIIARAEKSLKYLLCLINCFHWLLKRLCFFLYIT